MRKTVDTVVAVLFELLAIACAMVFLPYLAYLCYKAYFGRLNRNEVIYFRDEQIRLVKEGHLGQIVEACVVLGIILYPYPEPVSLWAYGLILWVVWTFIVCHLIKRIANSRSFEPLR